MFRFANWQGQSLVPTRHALEQCAARGIPLNVAEIAFTHGIRSAAGAGVIRHHLTRFAAWKASTLLGSWVLHWEGVCVVVAEDRLITAFWAPEPGEVTP